MHWILLIAGLSYSVYATCMLVPSTDCIDCAEMTFDHQTDVQMTIKRRLKNKNIQLCSAANNSVESTLSTL